MVPDPVTANSQAVMEPIDALPPEWRALVHEYGRNRVLQFREDGLSLEDAADELWLHRKQRQQQWLKTDYITPRARQSFEGRV